jgi:3-oxoadipate enol-lactonase
MTGLANTQTFRIGPAALRYRLVGDPAARPLVCVHGVGSYLEAWDEAAEALAQRFRVLTFDLRGHGRSGRPPGPYEIEDFIDDLLALAEHVGMASFHLAGFSLGGLIAQGVAIAHPDRVRSLMLLSTVADRTPDEQARVRQRLKALQETDPNSHHDASLSRWVSEAFQAENPARIAELRRRDAENDPASYAAAYRVLAETDFGPVLGRIGAPTLVVTGAEDQGSTPRMARVMRDRIPGAKLRILPKLRHSILIEAPAVVAGVMLDFLAEAGAPAEAGSKQGGRRG